MPHEYRNNQKILETFKHNCICSAKYLRAADENV